MMVKKVRKVVNKEFSVAGVRNLMLTNYGVDPSLLDIESLVDGSISMSENWAIIKPKVIALCEKPHKSYF